jgi:hypothetical protein
VNVKFTQSLDLIPSATASVPSISYAKSEPSITAVAAAETSISASVYLPPLTALQALSVTVTDVATLVHNKGFTESLVASDTFSINFTLPSLASSVTVASVPNKIINSSIDFDLSDADVDPDPITVVDSISNQPSKPITSTAITATDSISNQPGKAVPGDTVTAGDTDTKDINPAISSAVTAGDTDTKDINSSATSAVTIASSPVLEPEKPLGSDVTVDSTLSKVFNSSVDFDMSDEDVDPDPATAIDAVVMGPGKSIPDTVTAASSDVKSVDAARSSSVTAASSISNQPSKPITGDAITPGDAVVLTPGREVSSTITMASLINTVHYNKNQPNSVTAGDSIVTTLTLGSQNRPFSQVFMSDGETGFIHTPRNIPVPCYNDLLGNVHSLVNSARVHSDECADSTRYEAHTGTIGAPGLVNEPIMNGGLITYPDTSGAGFVVDFHYPTLTIGNYMANIALIN